MLKYAAFARQRDQARAVAAPRPPTSRAVAAKTRPSLVPARIRAEHAVDWLNHNPVARDIAGETARNIALVPGAARGLWHTAEDLGHAAYLAYGVSPLTFREPAAALARDELMAESLAIGQKFSDAIDDPKAAIEGVKRGLHDWRATIDPTATPKAATATGEIRRQFPIGLNEGELAGDVLSLFYGGAELKPLRLARLARASTAAERAALRASKLGPWSPTAAHYMAKGIPPGLAEQFATPYEGWGHH